MAAEETKMGELLFRSHEFMIKSRESKQIEEEEEEEEEKRRPWRDLPEELVHNILSRLLGRDFIRLQTVCKSWKSSTMSFAILTPCLLMLNNKSTLHYPISNSTIGMDMYGLPYNSHGTTTIRSSNYSWLLMTIDHADGILFFNHFTNAKIELPPIHLAISLCCFSFSAPPTSPDCTVFCITTAFYRKIIFCILKRGESEWTTLEFDREDHFIASSCNSLLYKGHYCYSLSKQGDLVIYDTEKNEPRWIKSATSFLRNRLSTKRSQSFMAESDGELLAVFMSCDGEWVQVCKLDESRMIWVPVHDLGDKSLFISNPATFAETISVKGTENKVYVPWFRGSNKLALFYSLATRRYHSFAGGSYTSLYESTRPPSSTWIKPISHHQTCNLQFKFTW